MPHFLDQYAAFELALIALLFSAQAWVRRLRLRIRHASRAEQRDSTGEAVMGLGCAFWLLALGVGGLFVQEPGTVWWARPHDWKEWIWLVAFIAIPCLLLLELSRDVRALRRERQQAQRVSDRL